MKISAVSMKKWIIVPLIYKVCHEPMDERAVENGASS